MDHNDNGDRADSALHAGAQEARVTALRTEAVAARNAGNFQYAADLFRQAALLTGKAQVALNSQLRRAYCLVALEQRDKAVIIAERVVQHARSEALYGELIDALGLLADHHVDHDRLASANECLAEALYVLGQLDADEAPYQALHNLAVTLARCNFLEPAIEMYDRALRVAANDEERVFAYANLAASYNLVSLTVDPARRPQVLADGLYAATAALDAAVTPDVMAEGLARSHRAMLLAQMGHYTEALADASLARGQATVFGMREEQVTAAVATCIAEWRLNGDRAVLATIRDTMSLAHEIEYLDILTPLRDLEIEVLSACGRHAEAAEAQQRELERLRGRLRAEYEARWAQIRLGIDGRHTDMLAECDPLTGLGNRRFLSSFLADEMTAASRSPGSPSCVAVVDIDQFSAVNDEHGYAAGDHVLQELGRLLERICRRGDAVVRTGGDEFVVVLRGTSLNDARTVLERTRVLIAHHRWDGLPGLQLTVSVGIAVCSPERDPEQVVGDARAAAHIAKLVGQDRVELFTVDHAS